MKMAARALSNASALGPIDSMLRPSSHRAVASYLVLRALGLGLERENYELFWWRRGLSHHGPACPQPAEARCRGFDGLAMEKPSFREGHHVMS